MGEEEYAAAKELFFAYDGLHSDMGRDGVEAAYGAYCVPPELDAAWLDELLQEPVAGLNRPATGNRSHS